MNDARGHALVTAVLAGILITVTAVSVLQQASLSLRLTRHADAYEQAWYLAHSALERCAAEVRYRADLRSWWPAVAHDPPTVVCSFTEVPLAGGTWSARLEKVGPRTLQGRFSGRFGPVQRTLGATLQFADLRGGGDSADLIGGGDLVFGGGGYVEGVIVANGRIRLDGGLTFCGQAYARERVTVTHNVALPCGTALHPFVPDIRWPAPFWNEAELSGWARPDPAEARQNGGRTEFTWNCTRHPDWCDGTTTAIYIPGWLVFTGDRNDIDTRVTRVVARDGVTFATNVRVNDDGGAPVGRGLLLVGVQDGDSAPGDQVAVIESNARVRRLHLYVLNATVKWNSARKSSWWGRIYARSLDAANGIVDFHSEGGDLDGTCTAGCAVGLRVTALWEEPAPGGMTDESAGAGH